MAAKVLWPSRESLYDLMKLRASIGRAAFGSEKQNDPINPEACEWPPEYFDCPGFWFDQWPDSISLKALALDPSKGKESKVSDFWAYVVLGRCEQSQTLYCEAELRRGPTDVMIDTGMELLKLHKPDGFAIETNTFQELLVAPFTATARKRRIDFPVYEVNNSVNKEVRIRRLTPDLSQRRIRFKARSPGTQLMVDQMRAFPQANHDDGPDALEMAKRLLVALWNGSVKKRKKR